MKGMKKCLRFSGSLCVLAGCLAFFSGCAGQPRPPLETPDTIAETPSPVEILEVPEIAAEITALPMETATPDPALDAALLSCARNTGNVSDDHMRIVLRYLSKTDPAAYLSWLTTEERTVTFYREIPFENGTLVLAMEPYDGETDPNLYYVLEGRVAAQSYGADCWSIDVARFLGKTVVFGPAFTQLNATGKIVASFFDGQVVEQSLDGGGTSLGLDDGYILVADGTPDLKTLTVFSGSTPVADQSTTLYHQLAETGRSGSPMAVFDAVHLCVFSDKAPDQDNGTLYVTGGLEAGTEVSFTKYFKNAGGWIYTDAWRNNNSLWGTVAASGGTTLELSNVPPGVMAAYVVDPSLDNGTDAGASKARKSIELNGRTILLPGLTPGTHAILMIETADTVYALALKIQ